MLIWNAIEPNFQGNIQIVFCLNWRNQIIISDEINLESKLLKAPDTQK